MSVIRCVHHTVVLFAVALMLNVVGCGKTSPLGVTDPCYQNPEGCADDWPLTSEPDLDSGVDAGDVETPLDVLVPLDGGACEPESPEAFCARYDAVCGEVIGQSICGESRTVFCGSCSQPETCGGSGDELQCGCMAAGCEALGLNCGTFIDDCGASHECGECGADEFCGGAGANRCGQADCIPEDCASLSAACGTISDCIWEQKGFYLGKCR